MASTQGHWRAFPCGDSALTIECAEEISLEAFEAVQRLRRLIEKQPINGVSELVPAFTTLTLVLNIAELSALTAEPFAFILHQVEALLFSSHRSDVSTQTNPIINKIPVCYDDVYAPDLSDLAAKSGLSCEEVVRLHTEADYRVAMLGFTPGFPYLLGLHPLLIMPRKQTPRQHVVAGAVGIAGAQTGIYPIASPGGWNIIGQTPLRLFTPFSSTPTLFKSGDVVQFYAITAKEFEERTNDEERANDDERTNGVVRRAVSIPEMRHPNPSAATILQTGLQAMIQDAGRTGWREYGIPQSGATDSYSFALANILVGNARTDAVLEVLPGGFAMRFERDTLIALTGADMGAEATLSTNTGGTLRVPLYRPVLMRSGAVLRLRNPACGLRSYIAFAGGINTPLVLGSRSTYQRAGLGGIEGKALRKGDSIGLSTLRVQNEAVMRLCDSQGVASDERLTASFRAVSWSFRAEIPMQQTPCTLRVIRGAEFDQLTEASKQALFGQNFRVLPNSDRMGLRLHVPNEAQALMRSTEKQVISRAVMPGTVQLPPDGQPIVLLADSQTTGGYPVIAHCCNVDLPRAAQLRANDQIVFEECTLEEAQKLYIERERSLKILEWRIQSR